ncbi:MAG: SET domain-containing protein-lysine N-methyltransferase [Promethearchaeota archaeon]
MISIDTLLEIIYISPKKGKGIFAKRFIKKGTLVEIGHVILLSNKDYDQIQDTILYQYVFEWDDPNKPDFQNAIALSQCQFFNHSYKPNLKYAYDYENQTIEYIAIRNIKKGEELTVNYNGHVRDKSPMWFEVE